MEQNKQHSSFNLADFSKNSEFFYNEIKVDLESKYKGKYAALDFETKKYWIGETASEALSKAKSELPNKLFYLVQVGSPATFSIQSMVGSYLNVKNRYDSEWQYR